MSILKTQGITKDYPGTRALDDVTVSFEKWKGTCIYWKKRFRKIYIS